MSVVLDRPLTRPRAPRIDSPSLRQREVPVGPSPRVVDVPTVAPVKVRRRSGVEVCQFVISKLTLFACFFISTYVASSLGGHYLVEKSRNQSIEATNRANAAVQAEKEVQRRLDVVTGSSAIEEWALSHSFRPTDGLGQTSKVDTRVASNL